MRAILLLNARNGQTQNENTKFKGQMPTIFGTLSSQHFTEQPLTLGTPVVSVIVWPVAFALGKWGTAMSTCT